MTLRQQLLAVLIGFNIMVMLGFAYQIGRSEAIFHHPQIKPGGWECTLLNTQHPAAQDDECVQITKKGIIK